MLTVFINFSDFLTFDCRKESNDVTIQQMMSTCFFAFNLLLIGFLTTVKSYIDIGLVALGI